MYWYFHSCVLRTKRLVLIAIGFSIKLEQVKYLTAYYWVLADRALGCGLIS